MITGLLMGNLTILGNKNLNIYVGGTRIKKNQESNFCFQIDLQTIIIQVQHCWVGDLVAEFVHTSTFDDSNIGLNIQPYFCWTFNWCAHDGRLILNLVLISTYCISSNFLTLIWYKKELLFLVIDFNAYIFVIGFCNGSKMWIKHRLISY